MEDHITRLESYIATVQVLTRHGIDPNTEIGLVDAIDNMEERVDAVREHWRRLHQATTSGDRPSLAAVEAPEPTTQSGSKGEIETHLVEIDGLASALSMMAHDVDLAPVHKGAIRAIEASIRERQRALWRLTYPDDTSYDD